MNAPTDIFRDEDVPQGGVILQKLSVRHKQAMALLAQGVDRVSIASLVDYSPEYITWLTRQPLCQDYLRQMNEHVQVRLDALFDKSVEVIAQAMDNGTVDERLKAARLQMEATHRLGKGAGTDSPVGDDDRLEQLAQRLVGLLRTKRQEVTYEDTVEVQDANDQRGLLPLPDTHVEAGIPA